MLLIVQPPCPVIVIFDHTAYRNRKPEFRQYLFCHMHLSLSTIHQDQVRELTETTEFLFFFVFLFLNSSPEPPCQHFFHAGVIVRSLYRFDLKLAIIVSFRFSFFINHHGTYRLKSADVGDIIGLYPLQTVQFQKIADFFHSSDCSSLFPFQFLLILGQYHSCIPCCQFHQFLFRSLFRHPDMHFLSPFFTEPLLQHFNLINISLQHQLFRDKRCPCIELFHKIQKDLRWCGICCDPQIEMISSDHFTFPDKKHLCHCIFFIHRHRDHILILSLTSGNLLTLTDLLYTLHQITIFPGLLKTQLF